MKGKVVIVRLSQKSGLRLAKMKWACRAEFLASQKPGWSGQNAAA